jgi:DNA-binding response OmpR family regulator
MAYLLMTDDDEDFLLATAIVLRKAGHEVDTETQTDKVAERIWKRMPDLLILDVMFPEDASAGFDLARTIRRTFHDMKILMLTAVNTKFPLGFGADDIDDEWLPVTDFLEKPVDLDVLRDRVEALVAKKNKES